MKIQPIVAFVVLSLMLFSCDKDCVNPSVNGLRPGKVYATVKNARTFPDKNGYHLNEYFIKAKSKNSYTIRDQAAWDSIILSPNNPVGKLDFNRHFVMAHKEHLVPHSKLIIKTGVYADTHTNTLKVMARYALHGTCESYGTYPSDMTIIAVIPIAYKNYTLNYDIKCVNP
ncbi:MAG: hypothetical protein H6585_09840 [Flavobacteriales bacterium]|nr:hypothetical protein [Flavobacteriales bacterium]MCB9448632.1 hypothetical protein [Flavobacteriales bacterium]